LIGEIALILGKPIQQSVKLMVMEPISIEKAKEIAKKKGLKPGRVRTTKTAVQLTKGKNENVIIISWDEFEDNLKKRKLGIYESSGWMRIMRKK
jgi:acetylglutamate kinase